jgi:muconate cycloisomerase
MRIRAVTCFDLSIPLRLSFRHSLAERNCSRNLIVRAELDNGRVGYGEGVPVSYVTGETMESAVAAVRDHYFPLVRGRAFSSYEQLGRWLCDLQPLASPGICHTSAKCAFELALLDAFGREFSQSLSALAALVPLPPPAAAWTQRPSYGVAVTADSKWIRRRMALLKLYGFRDFKLKVGVDAKADREITEFVARRLSRRLARRKATLRVDANAAYPSAESAYEALEPLVRLGVECVEQPLAPANDPQVANLARRLRVPVLLDESVRTLAEAAARLNGNGLVGLNIRLSKNGGFFDSLRLAALCRERRAPFQLGCHVGETGILAAAQCHLAALLPDARYLEGAFGTRLLAADIVRRAVRFGFRGCPPRLGRIGLGVEVDDNLLRKFSLSSVRDE